MTPTRRILVTGATGKVGQAFIRRMLAATSGRSRVSRVRALCHNRVLDPAPRLEVVRGSIADRDVVDEAMAGVTHVLHLATTKETPETVMDVAVKGLFWLLEACPGRARRSSSSILVGGDAASATSSIRATVPVTESRPARAPIRAATRSRRCSRR